MQAIKYVLAAILFAVITACGGGGGDPETAQDKATAERCLYKCGPGQWNWEITLWGVVVEVNNSMSSVEPAAIPGGQPSDQTLSGVIEPTMATLEFTSSSADPGYIPSVEIRLVAQANTGKFVVYDTATGLILYNGYPLVVDGKRYIPTYRKRWSCGYDC